ncbi:MAG: protein-glutamate O-methyltransferase CheR [Pontiellaceae bacterium]|nr:protein-glutamate O-methyltransferase CheR [Pontiellaceae bacterium]
MKKDTTAQVEIDQLLEELFKACGYDFRQYARASIERRIRNFLSKSDYRTIPEITYRLAKDKALCARLVHGFSVPVTELFRDPFVYRSLRENVAPQLKTYPFIKIWIAGCASGEEAYSLAILLKEEGLYDRATMFVTDFNEAALKKAKQGIYSVETIREGTRNYQDSGGETPFSEYYQTRYNAVAFDSSLRKNMTFANYNLTTDGVFGEMHLIFCRNVLIYFNRDLQSRVLALFNQSLCRNGFLCLGTKETVSFIADNGGFEPMDRKARIFRKNL